MIFTETQTKLLAQLNEWLNEPEGENQRQFFIIDGFAGTGKTTVISHFLKSLKNIFYIVMTYTGKASVVLMDKGTPSQTIHSYLYEPVRLTFEQKQELGTKDDVIYKLKSPEEYEGDLLVIDESSFISKKLWDDLLTTRKRMIVLGDKFQLSIDGSKKFEPDFRLTEVLRQALDNPIISDATNIRRLRSVGRNLISKLEHPLDYYDQILCSTNKTRKLINETYRKIILNRKSDEPEIGDRIIFLQNNREDGIFNGLMDEIDEELKVFEDWKKAIIYWWEERRIFIHFGDKAFNIKVDFFRGTYRKVDGYGQDVFTVHPVDYGYCITGHKSQGSEWDKVLILKEGSWLETPSFFYTCITRARVEYHLVDINNL